MGEVQGAWGQLKERIGPTVWNCAVREYPALVRKALPGQLLDAFEAVDHDIAELQASDGVRNFFRLALLSLIPSFSRAIATGGWPKWVNNSKRASSLPRILGQRVGMMMDDILQASYPRGGSWKAMRGDARAIPENDDLYTAVITSPPYPNRHDYTRVFGVELMFGFVDWRETRELRNQSFHSHPEAHPEGQLADGYVQPAPLGQVLERIRENARDPRVPRMSLREIKRLCRKGARIGWVVGNAQYCGEALPVDELTAEIGEQARLTCEKLLVARYRGNSAQQMGRYGRSPSRESVVVFRNA